jgi:hypothetical protein
MAPSAYTAYAVEGFRPTGRRARTVIVSGDSVPPRYLGCEPSGLARAIASFRPELVVLDTCYGASTPLLEALASSGVKARVVAPAYRLPLEGLMFAAGFSDEPDPARRAWMVSTQPVYPLLRWTIDAAALRTAEAQLAGFGPWTLRARLKHVRPPLVELAIAGAPGPAGRVLAPVPPDRLR